LSDSEGTKKSEKENKKKEDNNEDIELEDIDDFEEEKGGIVENKKEEKGGIVENKKEEKGGIVENKKEEKENKSESGLNSMKKEQKPSNIKNEDNINDFSVIQPDNKLLSREKEEEINENKRMYEKIMHKYSEQEKNLIDNIVHNIYCFDTENPNLNGVNNFHYINELKNEEKKLSEIIENFNEKIIKPENQTITESRKNYFYLTKFTEGKINKLFISFIQEHKDKIASHVKDMQKLYEESIMKNILSDIDENSEQEIFEKMKFLDSLNNPIGNFENLQTLIYKFSLYENSKVMFEFQKNFFYWRNCITDGNTFYRTVMFCIIENYIINNNVKDLTILICEILSKDYCKLYNNKNINVTVIKDILSLILYYVKKHKIKEAYSVFLKSYLLKSKYFDEALIIYLKHVLSIYLNKIFEYADNEPSKQYKNLKSQLSNIDGIEEFGIEAGISLICLLPFVFKINLIFIYLDGLIQKCHNGLIKCEPNEDENSVNLIIGNLFCSYYIFYPREINQIIKYENNIKEIKIKQLTYVSKEKEHCKICNNDEEHIKFLEKKYTICKSCLTNYLNNIITKRAKDMKDDNLFGLEYYSRRIHLQDKYYIDNDEFIEIRGKNILEELYSKIAKECYNCKHEKNPKSIFTIKCGCSYCSECIDDLLKKLTKDLIILNKYELNNMEKIKCSCNKDINPKDLLLNIKNVDKLKEDAMKRMIKYTKTLCMNCCKEIANFTFPKQNEKSKIISIEKLKIIKIKVENVKNKGLDYYDGDHVMCINCYQKWKNNINNDDKNDKNKGNDEVIVRAPHDNNKKEEIKDNKKDIKKDDKNINEKKNENEIKCNICDKYHIISKESVSSNECIIL
jgi:hypothetical protein